MSGGFLHSLCLAEVLGQPRQGELEVIVTAEDLKAGSWLEIRGWDKRYMGQHIRVPGHGIDFFFPYKS